MSIDPKKLKRPKIITQSFTIPKMGKPIAPKIVKTETLVKVIEKAAPGQRGERGEKGEHGFSGRDGFHGRDGSPDTPEEIKSKLESLSGDDRLDASAIKNLPRGRGGKLMVVAGAGGGGAADGNSGGTVTSVSVTTANGVSGTVATNTTTPAISLTLGAITPTTVNGLTIDTTTGTLDIANATTLTVNGSATITNGTHSGTNTGDQTNITGNAATVTVANEATDTSCFPLFAVSATGSLEPKTVASLTFNSNTGALGATNFVGTFAGNTFTTGTGVLTIAASKTLTASNTLTLAGTDGTTMTFPSTSATIARTDAGQTFTGVQAMTSPDITTSLTTPSTTFALLNATATTVNAFAATTTLNIGASATCILNFGGSTTASEFRFLEPSGSGTNYSAFKAVAQGASITYSLPPTVGAANTQLTDVAGNGVLTWEAAGGAGAVTVATISISAAQMVALNASPVQLIADPGDGFCIIIDELVFSFTVGGTQYTGGSTVYPIYAGQTANIFGTAVTAAIAAADINGAVSFIRRYGPITSPPVLQSTSAIQLFASGAEFATGNGTAKCFVKYRTITL